jgi:hypothetical protein
LCTVWWYTKIFKFFSPKTYQYNLETLKRKVSSNTVLSIKLSL